MPRRQSQAGSLGGVEDDLRRLLTELSAAIDRTQTGYPDREELARLLAAVEQRLQKEEAPAEEHHRLLDSLRAAEGRFEAEHPVLGSAIQQAIQVLSSAGI